MSNYKKLLQGSFVLVCLVVVGLGGYYVFTQKADVQEDPKEDLFAEESVQRRAKKKLSNTTKKDSFRSQGESKKPTPLKPLTKETVATAVIPVKTSDKLVKNTLEAFEKMPGSSFISPQLKGVVNELYKDLFEELGLNDEEQENLMNHLVNTEKLQIKTLQDIMQGKLKDEEIVAQQKELYQARRQDLKSVLKEDEVAQLDSYQESLPAKVRDKYVEQRVAAMGIDEAYQEEISEILRKTMPSSTSSAIDAVGKPLKYLGSVEALNTYKKQMKNNIDPKSHVKDLDKQIEDIENALVSSGIPEDQRIKALRGPKSQRKIMEQMLKASAKNQTMKSK